MDIQSATYVISSPDYTKCPKPDRPEYAFIGRSNVGKSSLINALTGRKALARTSNTPGRTQELIFFHGPDRLVLVDMPGYGYAATAKKKIAAWTSLIHDYLRGRAEAAGFDLAETITAAMWRLCKQIKAELESARPSNGKLNGHGGEPSTEKGQ